MRFLAFFAGVFAFTSAFAADGAKDTLPIGQSKTTASTLITAAPLKGDYIMGKKEAPVTLVEYASLSCTHCAHFANNVLPELEKNYISQGKLLYIMRPFPLNEPALKASMLIDCVGEQDAQKYYTFAKVLFGAQDKWAFDSNFLASLETFANVGGVSKEQFQACVNNPERETKMLKAKKTALDELQISGTPAFFIGNERYTGALSPEAISKAIDARLAGKK